MELVFYREGAVHRVSCEPRYALLARFLEGDLQESAAIADRVLAILESVRKGVRKKAVLTGNAHTIILLQERVRLESDFDPLAAPLEISSEEFRDAVRRWRGFVSSQEDARL